MLLNSTVQVRILMEQSEPASTKIMGTNLCAKLLQCARLRIKAYYLWCVTRDQGVIKAT